jgi:uncharacterized protein DUF4387
MPELWTLTKLIRSKNAGPFELTFDIMFKDRGSFQQAVKSGSFTREEIARRYRVPPDSVKLFFLENISTIKISIPRSVPSGDACDTDIYGGQFHSPLVRMQI